MPAKRKNEEEMLQRASKTYFEFALPDVLAFHVPNGGWRNKIEAARLKAMGVLPGAPDWLLFWQNGMGALELKSSIGILSENQKIFKDRWENLGGRWAMARTLDVIESTILSWGLKPKYQIPRITTRSKRQITIQAALNFYKPWGVHNE